MEVKPKPDPITLSLIDGRLVAISMEIARVLIRTSRSPLFAFAHDFDTATLDKDRRLISQSDLDPAMTCCIPPVMDNIVEEYGDDICEGDIFLHNDPYGGNTHPPDTNVVKPVFYEGELAFWTVCKAHLLDIGCHGGVVAFNPHATVIWEDGLIVPAVKLYEKGKLNTSLWKVIFRQIRLREVSEADLMCEIAAVNMGNNALVALLDRYGKETVQAAVDELMISSEREMRERISLIPDGVYYGEASSDYNGIDKTNLVTVRVKVTKAGSDIICDFSDSDPQNNGYMNSAYGKTLPSAVMAIFAILPGEREVRRTSGAYRAVQVVMRKGTCVDAEFPHSTGAGTLAMGETIIAAVWDALREAIPEWVPALWARDLVPCMEGFNPRTGRNFSNISMFDFGGTGAVEGFDGWDHTVGASPLGQNVCQDIEISELVFPVRVWQNELVMDSAAAGKYCGSHATITRTEALTDDIKLVMIGSGARTETAPVGVFGAKDPKPAKARIVRADGRAETWDVHEFNYLNKGDMQEVVTTSGGGMGDPFERPIEKVLAEFMDELLSVEKAREDYGVVINSATHKVDAKATEELRQKHCREQFIQKRAKCKK